MAICIESLLHWRVSDQCGGTADAKRLSMFPHHGDRAFGAAAGLTGKFRKIQLLGHAWRCKDWARHVRREGEYRTAHIDGPPIPVRSLLAAHPGRSGVPAAWYVRPEACLQETGPCSCPVLRAGQCTDRPWPGAPTKAHPASKPPSGERQGSCAGAARPMRYCPASRT